MTNRGLRSIDKAVLRGFRGCGGAHAFRPGIRRPQVRDMPYAHQEVVPSMETVGAQQRRGFLLQPYRKRGVTERYAADGHNRACMAFRPNQRKPRDAAVPTVIHLCCFHTAEVGGSIGHCPLQKYPQAAGKDSGCPCGVGRRGLGPRLAWAACWDRVRVTPRVGSVRAGVLGRVEQ